MDQLWGNSRATEGRKTRKPVVRAGRLRLADSDQAAADKAREIALEDAQWQQWLAHNTAFVYEAQAGRFTAQAEVRRGHAYWYGYRRRNGKLHKVYLGRTGDLLPARLEAAGRDLAGARPADAAAPALAELQPTGQRLAGPHGVGPHTVGPRLAWARLAPPALPPRLVERTRLAQRINTPLTLIYAPSGFGKSTLLNAWRQSCGRPVAWVSLTEAENEPVRFWTLLVAALQLALEPGVDLAAYLQVTDEGELPGLLAQLSSDLAQQLDAAAPAASATDPAAGAAAGRVSIAAPPRLAIVLDDYHHLRSPQVNGLLQGWLEHWPPALQLILSGHIKPPLAVGRLRARGLVTELDADDLRFTVEEGVQFLQQHQPAQGGLAQRDMQTLVQRARGWASGLLLAAMALARQPDRQAFLDSFSGAHSYLSEFFLENVFERQGAEVQAFLLQTAILRQLTGGLCDAVTGRSDSARLLHWLAEENLFLVQLEQPGVYQYHTLFAEALQGELQRRLPAALPTLHRRAAEWHRRRQEIDEAVYHLLAVGAWEEAATLIEEIAVRELVEFGEDSRLLRWLRQLPPSVVQGHKTLLLLYMRLARMGLSALEVGRFLASIEDRIRARTPGERTADEEEVLGAIEQLRAPGAGGFAGSDEVAGAGRGSAPAGGRYAAVWQLLASLDEVMETGFQGRRDEEVAQVLGVYAAALREGNLFVALMAGGNCVTKLLLLGQLRRARQLGEQVLQHALQRRGVLPEPASIALHGLAVVAFERDEMDRCAGLLARVREVDPNPTSTNMPITAAILAARLQAAAGDQAAAQATLQSARLLHARRPSGVWAEEDIVAYEAWCAVRSGDLAGTQTLLAGIRQAHPLSDLVRAELLLAQGQPAEAAALLQGLLATYPQHLRRESHMRTRLLLAQALFSQGQVHASRRLLAAAVRAAAPEGCSRPLREYAGALAPLLALVAGQETLAAETRQFLRPLLAPGALATLDSGQDAGRAAAPGALAVLTPREGEVLHLLAAGCTNAEIARRLTLAESTVKTHLANIYTKLRASNRVEAVAWLRETRT